MKIKTIAIAAVASLAIVATLGEAGSSGDSSSDTSASSSSGESSDSTGEGSDSGDDAQAGGGGWYQENYGTFKSFTEKGSGDGIVKLPAEAAYGVVTATHKGSSNFSLTVLDEDNQSTGDLLVNEIGNYKGTTAYGFISLGNPGVKIQVTADGDWTIKVAEISSAPVLSLPAKGSGDAVFLYDGGAADWSIQHKGDSNFALVQYSSDLMPNLAVNEIGNYKGVVPMSAGPSVIVITADGSWSLSE